MDEEHPLNPRSPYAATKAGADRLAYSYFVTYGLPIVIVRPFNNYGPRQHPEKVIPRFITQALSGEPLTIHGDGHAIRDWLYVDDDAEAIEAIIAADIDGLAGEVVNVATGIDISVRDVADSVLAAVGSRRRSRLRRRAARPGRPPHRLDRQARAADRLARADELRARARADGRVVPRERGVVAGSDRARQRLLVLGAGPAQIGLLRAARERDLFVIAVDRDPPAPGFAYADQRAIVSTEDEPGIDRLAGRSASTGSSRRASTGRSASRRASPSGSALPHPIDAATAALATTKSRQRERFAEAGVPQPRSQLVSERRRRAADPVRRQGARPPGPARALARAQPRRSSRRRSTPRSTPRAASVCLVEELRRRAGGDGQRRLDRRRLPPAARHRPRHRRPACVRRRAGARLALCF